jgi:hypothetical protein
MANLDSLSEVVEVAKLLAASGYFEGVRDMAQAVTKILAGREIGMGPVASLAGVYIERGKPCYSANSIAAAIKRSGRYNFTVKELTDTSCTLVFFEAGKQVGVSTFTMADAEKAELTRGKNAHSWRHYPRNMLFARALTNGARWYCADVGNGVAMYTREELDGHAEEPALLEASPTPALLTEPEAGKSIGDNITNSGNGHAEKNPHDAVSLPTPEPAPVTVLPDPQDEPRITPGQVRLLATIQRRANVSDDAIHAYLHYRFGAASRKAIPQSELNSVIEWLEERGAIAELEAA